jgi:hypothetical protein
MLSWLFYCFLCKTEKKSILKRTQSTDSISSFASTVDLQERLLNPHIIIFSRT